MNIFESNKKKRSNFYIQVTDKYIMSCTLIVYRRYKTKLWLRKQFKNKNIILF